MFFDQRVELQRYGGGGDDPFTCRSAFVKIKMIRRSDSLNMRLKKKLWRVLNYMVSVDDCIDGSRCLRKFSLSFIVELSLRCYIWRMYSIGTACTSSNIHYESVAT